MRESDRRALQLARDAAVRDAAARRRKAAEQRQMHAEDIAAMRTEALDGGTRAAVGTTSKIASRPGLSRLTPRAGISTGRVSRVCGHQHQSMFAPTRLGTSSEPQRSCAKSPRTECVLVRRRQRRSQIDPWAYEPQGVHGDQIKGTSPAARSPQTQIGRAFLSDVGMRQRKMPVGDVDVCTKLPPTCTLMESYRSCTIPKAQCQAEPSESSNQQLPELRVSSPKRTRRPL